MKNKNDIHDTYEQELQTSIANLYVCFSSYELREKMDACTCGCISPEDMALLYSKPLHELSPKELEKYSRKALSTWGDEYDLRHFLPRLFEIAGSNLYALAEIEILFSKLKYGKWGVWSRKEQTIIQEYFFALWKNFLARNKPEDYSNSDTYICAFSQALDDPSPFLNIWENMDNELAYEHLKLFIEWNKDALAKSELGNAFWEERQPQMKIVANWLRSSQTSVHFTEKLSQSKGVKKRLITNILDQLENI